MSEINGRWLALKGPDADLPNSASSLPVLVYTAAHGNQAAAASCTAAIGAAAATMGFDGDSVGAVRL